MSCSSSTRTHRWTYDVFVSFCNEDILKGFMSHLFTDFKRKGIHYFPNNGHPKDQDGDISSEIFEAIEKSRFLLVIFSKYYASSAKCLRELLKILNMKEMDSEHIQIRTVFYHVNPSMVRYQIGSYQAAFDEYKSKNKEEISVWRKALADAADLSGWDLEFKPNGFEAALVDTISKHIFGILSHGPLEIAENLVGLHFWGEKMKLHRFVKSGKVRPSGAHMIGICGMIGIGKTTLAKAIYNKLYIHFEGYSFCEDVSGVARLGGLPRVQKQILGDIEMEKDLKIGTGSRGINVIKQRLGNKRVLIVLDNVDHRSQLEALAGNRDWFLAGSLIIVTSRDKQLVNAHGIEEIYHVNCLNDDESLELFCLHAFEKKYPQEEFVELSHYVVRYAKGHPLALEVLADFLCKKKVEFWSNELKKLRRKPNIDIQKVLSESYVGLDKIQRKMFLDIACFFRGGDKDFVTRIVDGSDLFSDTDLRVLEDKSLITISEDKKLLMHDLNQQMGMEIARQESELPARRSRLWFPEEVCDILNNDKGTEAIQGIVLDLSSSEIHISSKTFLRMNNLRLLKLYYGCVDVHGFHIEHNHIPREDSMLNRSRSLDFLSNELRWLCWHGYPFKFLPSTFFPENLVCLDMSYSKIKQLWTENKKKSFNRLTYMKLSHCRNLIKTPDFTQMPNLEELVLEGCTNLVKVHASVGALKRLVVLNLKNCKNLRLFPSIFELNSLKFLNTCGCLKLEKVLKVRLGIETQVELHVDGTALERVPSSAVSLKNKKELLLGCSEEVQSRFSSSLCWPYALLGNTWNPMAMTIPPLLMVTLFFIYSEYIK